MNDFFIITRGGARLVIIVGNIVFKFPHFRSLYHGRKQNTIEGKRRNDSKYLAKLYCSLPFGLCNIMERVYPLAQPLSSIESRAIKEYFKCRVSDKEELDFLLEDSSLENFGLKNGEIIKLDWGGYGASSGDFQEFTG